MKNFYIPKKFFKRKGFTLIELLVVMAIIGILASTMVVTSIRGIAQSRDARRIQELYQVANALLQYYAIYDQYPDNTDTDLELGCWSDWDGGNETNEPDDFIRPLVDEGFLTLVPKEWTNIQDGWNSQCIYRYMRVQNPCGCTGWYAVLYGACEANKCPVNERPQCCDSSWGEGYGTNDPYDITIFLKER